MKSKDKTNLEKNLLLLKKLSKVTAKRSLGKPNAQPLKTDVPKPIQGQNDQESAFTEEEFKEFENTYFKK